MTSIGQLKREVRDAYSGMFGDITETAELAEWVGDRGYWAIKIWRNNVLPASESYPSQQHVGQERYIKKLWRYYKERRGL